jgi:hypothetical protein
LTKETSAPIIRNKTLRRRYANTADEAEKSTIMELIADLGKKLMLLDQAALLDAADMLADASAELEKAIAAAKTGPFDGYLAAMEEHLHNGDPLQARTVHVPAGRPAAASPPFTWRQSAVDALTLKKFQEVADWSMPRMLYLLEKYNGFGYRMRRVPTPYLWSFSNLYEKGKFVQDGRFDSEAVSKQCGAALMLKAVAEG